MEILFNWHNIQVILQTTYLLLSKANNSIMKALIDGDLKQYFLVSFGFLCQYVWLLLEYWLKIAIIEAVVMMMNWLINHA